MLTHHDASRRPRLSVGHILEPQPGHQPPSRWKLVAVDHKIKVGMLARLAAKQRVDERLWQRHVTALDAWLADRAPADEAAPFVAQVRQRRAYAAAELQRVTAAAYLTTLAGTLGADPSLAC